VKEYPPIVSVIVYNKLYDFFEQVLHFKGSKKIDLSNYIFRGHSHEEYELIPSALRIGNKKSLYKMADQMEEVEDSEFIQGCVEREILKRFYSKCDFQSLEIPEIRFLRKYNVLKAETLDSPLPESWHKLASLAQHYGCYTRLLDWTSDLNTAIYFAIIGNNEHDLQSDNETIDIWCLSRDNIGLLNIGKHRNKGKLLIFSPPYKGNPNLAAQRGVFTLWNNNEYIKNVDRRPLERIIYEKILKEDLIDFLNNKKPTFYLFKIPKKFIKELYNYLLHSNCTAAKLFPGYYGVAKEIIQDGLYK